MVTLETMMIVVKDNPECAPRDLPVWLVHDLMQPLNACGLALEQVRDELSDYSNPAVRQDRMPPSLAIIENAIRTEEHLLSSLRQYWQLSANEVAAEKEPVSLHEVFNAVGRRYSGGLSFSSLELTIADPGHVRVLSNTSLLADLLSRLCDNALAHARTSARLVVDLDASESTVKIDVVDDGVGFAPGIMTLLGMPFIKPRHGRTSGRKGLGLGLFLASSFAHLLGHRLEISSNMNIGACVSLIIDRLLPQPLDPIGKQELSGMLDPLVNKNILLVDDQDATGRYALAMIRSLQCRAERAVSSEDIQERMAMLGRVDIVLVSHAMWNRCGQEIRRAIGSLQSFIPPTIVMISDQDKDCSDNKNQCDVNTWGSVRLPLSPPRLRAVLMNAVSKEWAS